MYIVPTRVNLGVRVLSSRTLEYGNYSNKKKITLDKVELRTSCSGRREEGQRAKNIKKESVRQQFSKLVT